MSMIDIERCRKRETWNLVDALLEQRAAHDSLIAAMCQCIADLKSEFDDKVSQGFITYQFFVDHHPELIPEYVKVAYEERPESARAAVSAFHDEVLDLSKIACTGSDFKPW